MTKLIAVIFLFSLLHLPLLAQLPANQMVQAAFQKINSGQLDDAIVDLNKVLADSSDHFGALNMLGLAFRRKKDFAKSLTAYKKAQKVQPENPSAMFNLGVAYALIQHKDMAFEVLLEAKAMNAINVTNIGLSPAATILKDDARYTQLFPSPEEYADPFVEEGVEVIHDWNGEHQSDQFGWIGRNIGDVDKDGIMDITTSAPTNNEGAVNAGKIYVYSGKTGKLIWSFVAKDANGQLGMSIEAAGDVNGDGTPDVVAGAPYVNKTWVFSGKNGEVLYEWVGQDPKGAFGRGVKGVGDVDGDGFGEVLIGEPYQIWGAPLNSSKIDHAGKAYLYAGKDGTILQTWEGVRIGDGFGTALAGKTTSDQTLLLIGAPNAGPKNGGQVKVYKGKSTTPFFTIEADSTGNSLGGMFMSVVGDVDGDQVQDVYASDFTNGALGNATGRIYIHSGATGQCLLELTGEKAGEGFGIGVADAGDTNQDGHDDLVIGAWQHASAAPSGGKVYVYSGKDGGLLRTLTGKVVGETVGFDATGIGDVNGDGVVDLLLTSAWSAINGSQSGRMLLVSGKQRKKK